MFERSNLSSKVFQRPDYTKSIHNKKRNDNKSDNLFVKNDNTKKIEELKNREESFHQKMQEKIKSHISGIKDHKLSLKDNQSIDLSDVYSPKEPYLKKILREALTQDKDDSKNKANHLISTSSENELIRAKANPNQQILAKSNIDAPESFINLILNEANQLDFAALPDLASLFKKCSIYTKKPGVSKIDDLDNKIKKAIDSLFESDKLNKIKSVSSLLIDKLKLVINAYLDGTLQIDKAADNEFIDKQLFTFNFLYNFAISLLETFAKIKVSDYKKEVNQYKPLLDNFIKQMVSSPDEVNISFFEELLSDKDLSKDVEKAMGPVLKELANSFEVRDQLRGTDELIKGLMQEKPEGLNDLSSDEARIKKLINQVQVSLYFMSVTPNQQQLCDAVKLKLGELDSAIKKFNNSKTLLNNFKRDYDMLLALNNSLTAGSNSKDLAVDKFTEILGNFDFNTNLNEWCFKHLASLIDVEEMDKAVQSLMDSPTIVSDEQEKKNTLKKLDETLANTVLANQLCLKETDLQLIYNSDASYQLNGFIFNGQQLNFTFKISGDKVTDITIILDNIEYKLEPEVFNIFLRVNNSGDQYEGLIIAENQIVPAKLEHIPGSGNPTLMFSFEKNGKNFYQIYTRLRDDNGKEYDKLVFNKAFSKQHMPHVSYDNTDTIKLSWQESGSTHNLILCVDGSLLHYCQKTEGDIKVLDLMHVTDSTINYLFSVINHKYIHIIMQQMVDKFFVDPSSYYQIMTLLLNTEVCYADIESEYKKKAAIKELVYKNHLDLLDAFLQYFLTSDNSMELDRQKVKLEGKLLLLNEVSYIDINESIELDKVDPIIIAQIKTKLLKLAFLALRDSLLDDFVDDVDDYDFVDDNAIEYISKLDLSSIPDLEDAFDIAPKDTKQNNKQKESKPIENKKQYRLKQLLVFFKVAYPNTNSESVEFRTFITNLCNAYIEGGGNKSEGSNILSEKCLVPLYAKYCSVVDEQNRNKIVDQLDKTKSKIKDLRSLTVEDLPTKKNIFNEDNKIFDRLNSLLNSKILPNATIDNIRKDINTQINELDEKIFNITDELKKQVDVNDSKLLYLILTNDTAKLKKDYSPDIHNEIKQYIELMQHKKYLVHYAKEFEGLKDVKELFDLLDKLDESAFERKFPLYTSMLMREDYVIGFFEIANSGSVLLTETQKNVIHELVRTNSESTYQMKTLELFMGGGKTTVITPLIMAIFNLKFGKSMRLSCHDKMYAITAEQLKNTTHTLFNSELLLLDNNSYDLTNPVVLTELDQKLAALKPGGANVIMPNNFYLSIRAHIFYHSHNLTTNASSSEKAYHGRMIKLLNNIKQKLDGFVAFFDEKHINLSNDEGYCIAVDEKKAMPPEHRAVIKAVLPFIQFSDDTKYHSIILSIIKSKLKSFNPNINDSELATQSSNLLTKVHDLLWGKDSLKLDFGRNYGFSTSEIGKIVPYAGAGNEASNDFLDSYLSIVAYYDAIFKQNALFTGEQSVKILKKVLDLIGNSQNTQPLDNIAKLLDLKMDPALNVSHKVDLIYAKLIANRQSLEPSVCKYLNDLAYDCLTGHYVKYNEKIISFNSLEGLSRDNLNISATGTNLNQLVNDKKALKEDPRLGKLREKIINEAKLIDLRESAQQNMNLFITNIVNNAKSQSNKPIEALCDICGYFAKEDPAKVAAIFFDTTKKGQSDKQGIIYYKNNTFYFYNDKDGHINLETSDLEQAIVATNHSKKELMMFIDESNCTGLNFDNANDASYIYLVNDKDDCYSAKVLQGVMRARHVLAGKHDMVFTLCQKEEVVTKNIFDISNSQSNSLASSNVTKTTNLTELLKVWDYNEAKKIKRDGVGFYVAQINGTVSDLYYSLLDHIGNDDNIVTKLAGAFEPHFVSLQDPLLKQKLEKSGKLTGEYLKQLIEYKKLIIKVVKDTVKGINNASDVIEKSIKHLDKIESMVKDDVKNNKLPAEISLLTSKVQLQQQKQQQQQQQQQVIGNNNLNGSQSKIIPDEIQINIDVNKVTGFGWDAVNSNFGVALSNNAATSSAKLNSFYLYLTPIKKIDALPNTSGSNPVLVNISNQEYYKFREALTRSGQGAVEYDIDGHKYKLALFDKEAKFSVGTNVDTKESYNHIMPAIIALRIYKGDNTLSFKELLANMPRESLRKIIDLYNQIKPSKGSQTGIAMLEEALQSDDGINGILTITQTELLELYANLNDEGIKTKIPQMLSNEVLSNLKWENDDPKKGYIYDIVSKIWGINPGKIHLLNLSLFSKLLSEKVISINHNNCVYLSQEQVKKLDGETLVDIITNLSKSDSLEQYETFLSYIHRDQLAELGKEARNKTLGVVTNNASINYFNSEALVCLISNLDVDNQQKLLKHLDGKFYYLLSEDVIKNLDDDSFKKFVHSALANEGYAQKLFAQADIQQKLLDFFPNNVNLGINSLNEDQIAATKFLSVYNLNMLIAEVKNDECLSKILNIITNEQFGALVPSIKRHLIEKCKEKSESHDSIKRKLDVMDMLHLKNLLGLYEAVDEKMPNWLINYLNAKPFTLYNATLNLHNQDLSGISKFATNEVKNLTTQYSLMQNNLRIWNDQISKVSALKERNLKNLTSIGIKQWNAVPPTKAQVSTYCVSLIEKKVAALDSMEVSKQASNWHNLLLMISGIQYDEVQVRALFDSDTEYMQFALCIFELNKNESGFFNFKRSFTNSTQELFKAVFCSVANKCCNSNLKAMNIDFGTSLVSIANKVWINPRNQSKNAANYDMSIFVLEVIKKAEHHDWVNYNGRIN